MRLSYVQFLEGEYGIEEGSEEEFEILQEFVTESIVPALCSEGCQVEPDGFCPHGNPSVLIERGLI